MATRSSLSTNSKPSSAFSKVLSNRIGNTAQAGGFLPSSQSLYDNATFNRAYTTAKGNKYTVRNSPGATNNPMLGKNQLTVANPASTSPSYQADYMQDYNGRPESTNYPLNFPSFTPNNSRDSKDYQFVADSYVRGPSGPVIPRNQAGFELWNDTNADPRYGYIPPVTKKSNNSSVASAGEVGGGFKRGVNAVGQAGRLLGSTALDVGKSLLTSPIRVGASLAELPTTLGSGGKKTFKPFNVPGFGQVKTYARDAQDRINNGDGSKLNTAATILGVGGQAVLDTATLGSVAQGIKNKFFSGATTPQNAALNSKLSQGNKVAAGQIKNSQLLEGGRPVQAGSKTVNLLDPNYVPPTNVGAGGIRPGSVEALLEKAEGWQTGMKTLFDTALNKGDKVALQAILKQKAVPQKYLTTFAKEISNILK